MLASGHYRYHQKRSVLTEHMHVEKLGNISGAVGLVTLLERRPHQRALIGNHGTLLGRGLAGPHFPNQLPQPYRHGQRPR